MKAGAVVAGGDVINQTIFQGLFDPLLRGDAEQRNRIGTAARGPIATPPPKLFENVPPRDLNFTGREIQIVELHNLLMGANRTQVAIHGLGGIGKTSLATEYAHRYFDGYAGVWWAEAERRTLLIGSLAGLAMQIDPTLTRESDQEKVAKAGLARLSRSSTPYLLIFDNVEAPDAIRDLVPATGARLIITTRWMDWAGQAAELKLNVLDPNAAAHFLRMRAGRDDVSGAEKLGAALGHLPLALDHAGAYCRLAGSSFDDYRERIDARITRAPKGAAYPASIEATLSLAIEKASAEHVETEALLGLIAWLAPERIPLDLVPSRIAEGEALAEALMALSAVSLVEHATLDDGAPAINVHPLVQAATRARLEAAQKRANSIEYVASSLSELFPKEASGNPKLWPRCAELLPHVLALRTHKPEESGLKIERLVDLFAAAGDYLGGRLAYAESEELLRQVVRLTKDHFVQTDTRIASHVRKLASLLIKIDKFAEAETLLRQARETVDRFHGPLHDEFFQLQWSLVPLLLRRGSEDAESLARQHFEVVKRTPNFTKLQISSCRTLLATVCTRKDKLQEAEDLFRQETELEGDKRNGLQNLATCMFVAGRDSDSERLFRETAQAFETEPKSEVTSGVLYSLHMLGTISWHHGRYVEAEQYYRDADKKCRQSFSHDHSERIRSVGSLARFYRDVGRFTDAEPLFREMIEIEEATFGVDHPEVAGSFLQLAGMLDEAGRYTEAEQFFRRSLTIRETAHGINHPLTFVSLTSLSGFLYRIFRPTDAVHLYAEAVRRATGREWEQGLLYTLGEQLSHFTAEFKEFVGQWDEAESLRRTILDNEKRFGRTGVAVMDALNKLGAVLVASKQYPAAEMLFREAIEISEETGAQQFPITGDCIDGLANLLQDTGHNEEAEVLFRKAISIGERSVGTEHLKISHRFSSLGVLFRDTGRLPEAEELIRDAMRIRANVCGQDNILTARAQRNLATILLATGRAQEALQYARQALNTHEKVSQRARRAILNEGWQVGKDTEEKNFASTCAEALAAVGDIDEATILRASPL